MDVNINLWYHHDASLRWKKEEKLKDNKIYNAALYCRLSLDDGSVGESGSIQTQKIILEEYAKIHEFKFLIFI